MSKIKYETILEASGTIIGKDCQGYFFSKVSGKEKYIIRTIRLKIKETDIKEAIDFLVNKGQQ